MSPFDRYADCYDLFYRDKDYRGEAAYVAGMIRRFRPEARRILDLGCGTGRYVPHFVNLGFHVTGLDRSAPMLAQARRRCREEVALGLARFIRGDLRTYRSPERYEAVTALFHVMSYLSSRQDLAAGFRAVRASLEDGGFFFFDCWHGPGVLSDPPRNPTKRAADERVEAVRHTRAVLLPNRNAVRVAFDITVTDKKSGSLLERAQEVHLMRYFFIPEIEDLSERHGLQVVGAYAWPTRRRPSRHTWYAFFVLKAV